MSQVVDVNGYKVRLCKEGNETPCIRISDGKKIWYAKKVRFLGPSTITQNTFNPDNPNSPFIWIETEGEIEWE